MYQHRPGPPQTPFGWGSGVGYQSDPDTGLLLLGHRYYDPSVGRFLSQDPAGDGDNWYAYCENNPLSGVDPIGLVELTQEQIDQGRQDYQDGMPGTYDIYDVSEGLNNARVINTVVIPDLPGDYGSGLPSFQVATAKGNVGHSQGLDDLRNELAQHEASLQGGGYNTKERELMKKGINALKQKIKTQEKAEGTRGSRAKKFESPLDPTSSFKWNPVWTPPTITPKQAAAGGATASTTIVILIILKILTGPLPVP